MLAGPGDSTAMIFHALDQVFRIEKVFLEEPVSLPVFLSRRVKRLGIIRVTGQLLFKILVIPVLLIVSHRRLKEIMRVSGLNVHPLPAERIIHVRSANDKQTIKTLQELQPDIVVINGTRILSQGLLESVPAIWINMHAGITPLYRGVHGAYWALVQKRPDVCGVTVHVVDAGIDTGGILKQATIQPTKNDTFVTYPLLQLSAGIPLLLEAIQEIMKGNVVRKPNPPGESALFTHPTFWGYLWHWFRGRVK